MIDEELFDILGVMVLDEELFDILGVTVLLSLTVFQDSVSATMPITSLQIPLLGNPWRYCC